MRIKQIVLERKSEPSVRELAMTVARRRWWNRLGTAAVDLSGFALGLCRACVLNQSFFGGTKRVPSKVRLMDDLVLAPHVCDLLWKTLQESWEGSLIEKSRKPQKETKECQSSMMRFLLPLKILPLSLRFLLLLLPPRLLHINLSSLLMILLNCLFEANTCIFVSSFHLSKP